MMGTVHEDPRRFARITGAWYLLTFILGIAALRAPGDAGLYINLLAAAVYAVVTFRLYHLYQPASRAGSLLVAAISFTALTVGILGDLDLVAPLVNTLALFGAYCIGLGWLTLRAAFLPKALGAFLVFAGLGWLTYAYPPLSNRLGALAMAPGMLGEGALTLWLMIAGVDAEKWKAQASQASA